MRRQPPSWLPLSVWAPVTRTVSDAGFTVSPGPIVMRTTSLKRPVELPQLPLFLVR